MSRRSFLRFCTATAAVLALPAAYAPRIAAAVTRAPRVPLVWIRGQGCGGDTESFLRSSQPSIGELLIDLLSVDYLDALAATSGADADLSLSTALEQHQGAYIAVVEGSVPQGGNGAFCTIGGRPFADVVRAVSAGAAMTIAVGSCAFDGGVAAAGGGTTGAVGVSSVAEGTPVVTLPGCPVNVDNLAATLVHWLTFRQPPATDGRGRPLFAYGGLVHNQCERRAHFEFGEFALAWGDEGSQKGWCLYKLGCKGPETYANCPTVRYADKTSWPVRAGHGCIGCTMPRFWDAMTPAYRRLPPPIPFAPDVTADQVGQALVGGVGAMTVVHGAASYVRQRRVGAAERRRTRDARGEGPVELHVVEAEAVAGDADVGEAVAGDADAGQAGAGEIDVADVAEQEVGIDGVGAAPAEPAETLETPPAPPEARFTEPDSAAPASSEAE